MLQLTRSGTHRSGTASGLGLQSEPLARPYSPSEHLSACLVVCIGFEVSDSVEVSTEDIGCGLLKQERSLTALCVQATSCRRFEISPTALSTAFARRTFVLIFSHCIAALAPGKRAYTSCSS